jgi:CubicO group peptidase (beta-lactamase class C family)
MLLNAFRSGLKLSVLLGAVRIFLPSTATARADEAPRVAAEVADSGDEDSPAAAIKKLVPRLRAEHKLIGLGAMLTVDGRQIAAAVDGQRKKGSGVALELGDQWHLGSITKSVTATMIARLVEQGKLKWTTTVAECFGDDFAIHEDWRKVSLVELLTHTSGAPPNLPLLSILVQPPEGAERIAARRKAVAEVLAAAPAGKPGATFVYSNVGFTIAGAMAEKSTGVSWEDLVRQEVFAPLKLADAGFGPPKDDDQALSQPRGHTKLGPFKRAVGETDDNTPIIGPAGIIRMSLDELSRYGCEHLQGDLGAGTLLSAETYRRLHTPRMNNYAYGWVVENRPAADGGRLVWHNGSNTMWYAYVALLPELKAVVAVTSNDGDVPAAEAAAVEIRQACERMLRGRERKSPGAGDDAKPAE